MVRQADYEQGRVATGRTRDPKRETHWRALLAKFDSSGQSVRGFCARERVSEPSFYAWRRVIRERDARQERDGPPRRTGPAFVPVVVADPPGAQSPHSIVLELGGVPGAPGAPGGPALTLRLPAALPVRQVAELAAAILAALRGAPARPGGPPAPHATAEARR